MDKKLEEHTDFIKDKIKQLKQDLTNVSSTSQVEPIKDKIKQLYDFHQKTVRDFQHERLIHLLVTFFFSGLLLLSIVSIFLFASMPTIYGYGLLSTLVTIICAFLFITELFYVRHYYQLENGTQNLYKLSKKIYKLLES